MKSVRGSAPTFGIAPTDLGSETLLSLDHLLAAFRRQHRIVAICAGLGLVLGAGIALTSPRLYTASASLMIGPFGTGNQDDAPAAIDRGLDTGAVDSEVEVLRSDRIATAVAEALDLEDDPRFMDQSPSIIGRLRGLLPGGGPEALDPEEEARLRRADILAELGANVWIERIGESYVLKIDYTSRFPDLSAEIANAYTAAYLQDQIDSRIEAAKHDGSWLAAQLAEIERKAFDADLAAQRFRAGSPPAPALAAPPLATPGDPADANRQRREDSAQRVVRLRQLEREAETYGSLYQALLGRYRDSIERQSFPAASAHVVAPATPPLRPSRPRKSLILALGLMAGAGAGVAIGALRELRDRSFRAGTQIRDLGLPYLGTLPRITPAGHNDGHDHGHNHGHGGPPPTAPAPESVPESAPESVPESALIRPAEMRHVLDAPLSPFADTLRGAMAAVDAWRDNRKRCVIGLVSALPGEGRTTVAANLALLAATSGARTLLVDGDLRSAGLSRAISPATGIGLADAAANPACSDPARSDPACSDPACLSDPESGLALLSAQLPAMPHARNRVLSPTAMQALLDRAGPRHDYVFVDLPPLGLFSDVRAVSRCFDGFLLVVRWGETPRALVAALLAEDSDLRRKTIGALLNGAEPDRIRLYADRGSADYYRTDDYRPGHSRTAG